MTRSVPARREPRRAPRSVADRRPSALRISRLLAVFLVLVAVLLALAAPASAHAVLVSSSPADGQVVPLSPAEVRLQFSEEVNADLGGITVLDAKGTRVDTGDSSPGATRDQLKASLAPDLPNGAYVINYRVVSADGHPITGAVIFGVGEGTTLDRAAVQGLSARTDPGWEVVGAIARFVTYVAALLAAGLGFFLGFVHDQQRDRWKITPVVRIACIVAAVGAIATIGAQAALITGRGVSAMTDASVLRSTLTDSGLGWASVMLLVGLTLVHLSTDTNRLLWAQGLSFYGGLVVTSSFVLWGHATESSNAWVAVIADVVHVATAAAWFGGLVGLALTLRLRSRERTRLAADELVTVTGATNAPATTGGVDLEVDTDAATQDTDAETTPTRIDLSAGAMAGVLGRFSVVAAASSLAAAVAGGVLAWTQVGSPANLVSTTYGRLLLAKVAVVAVILALAGYNRFRLLPDLLGDRHSGIDHEADTADPDPEPDTAATPDRGAAAGTDDDPGWRRLLRTVNVEAVAIVLVLAVTAVLVNVSPARTAAGGSITIFNQTASLRSGDQVNLTINPNKAGFNQIHVQYIDASGKPADLASSVQMEFTLPAQGLGPITREAPKAGPGHFIVEGSELSIPGTWQIAVVARTSQFSLERTTFQANVGP